MIQRKYTFLTGILAGLVIAIGAVSAFSSVAIQTFGQTNYSNSQSDSQNQPSSQMMQGDSNKGMSFFSGEGVSMVDNVKVTGVLLGSNEISVSLKYSGNGTAPGVTVAAITQSMENIMPMSMMESDNSGNMMSGGMMPQMMGEGIHSGSNVLNSGWNSPSTITVKIRGNTTSDDDHVMVMLFPYIK